MADITDAGITLDEPRLAAATTMELRGRRRIHQKPNRSEVLACHRWIEGELALLHPTVVVALGVTAASALLGRAVTPSSILRANEGKARQQALAAFAADLELAAQAIAPRAMRHWTLPDSTQ